MALMYEQLTQFALQITNCTKARTVHRLFDRNLKSTSAPQIASHDSKCQEG